MGIFCVETVLSASTGTRLNEIARRESKGAPPAAALAPRWSLMLANSAQTLGIHGARGGMVLVEKGGKLSDQACQIPHPLHILLYL